MRPAHLRKLPRSTRESRGLGEYRPGALAGRQHAAAKQAIEQALSLSPHLARAHYFYAKALRNEGNYDEPLAHLREVLAQYPYDRVVHDDLGRILFLHRRYTEAIREFHATLAIDPEDLEANYNLMLCYTGLAQPATARQISEAIFAL